MKNLEKIKEKARSPKLQLAVGLTIATAAFLAPHSSKSYTVNCSPGSAGDCVKLTNGDWACTSGIAFNDCA